jgi:methionyl-tRNA formyltransferase
MPKNINKIKVFFIGTPDFAVPSLEALIQDASFEVTGVVTQPDKKAGRGQKLTPPPIKKIALKNNLKIYQPENIAEMPLPEEKADVLLVIAYAQIIPANWLSWPKIAPLNLHGSLLPRHRGASCIQASILAGDGDTGLTLIKINEKLDAGDIISQIKTKISPKNTYGSLYEKLSSMSADFLVDSLKKYCAQELTEKKQDEKLSTYALKIKKEDALIDWNKEAQIIEREIRAYSPWPSSYFIWQDKKIKMIKAQYNDEQKEKAGLVFSQKEDILISTKKGSLKILKIKPENKSEMSAKDFANGHPDFINSPLS